MLLPKYNQYIQDIILSFFLSTIVPCRPEIFQSGMVNGPNERAVSQLQNESDKSDDDGLPTLVANMNRMRPLESQADEDSDSNSDADASVIQFDSRTTFFCLGFILVYIKLNATGQEQKPNLQERNC